MLTEDVLNGNPQFEVDKDTIAFEVFQLSKDIEEAENFTPSIRFDPAKHLAFEEKHFKNVKKHTLNERKRTVLSLLILLLSSPFPCSQKRLLK